MLREFAGDEVADDAIDELEVDPVQERLEAQLAEARAVLKLVEWNCEGIYCPCCGGSNPELADHGKNNGHAPDCRLKKFLEGT